MAVGATNTDGKQMREYFAGNELEILASGNGILSTGLFDGMVMNAGTSVSAAISSASKGLGTDNPTAMNNLIADTRKMLNDDLPSISSDETNPAVRYFKVLGFAIHCISDTFAHRSFVLENDLNSFDKKDFSNYNTFKEKVKARKVEFRDVDDYTTNLSISESRGKYEDNPDIGATRFKDAKKGSSNLLIASLLKTGYSATWFRNPNFGTLLSGQNSYAE